jgi:hypothetical protein
MTLYNLKSSDGAWRITKFDNDLNVESSYITSLNECECPAGNRPTCRHRTMLSKMLNVGAEDSGMFYDFDTDQFLEPMADDEDTQPAIVSPLEELDATIAEIAQAQTDGELPPQAAQDMLSPSLHIEIESEVMPSDTIIPTRPSEYRAQEQSLSPAPTHPALSGPLKRRI